MEYVAVMVSGLLLGGWAVPLGFFLGLGPMATFVTAAIGGVAGCWVFLLVGDRVAALAHRRGTDANETAAPVVGEAAEPPTRESLGDDGDSGAGRVRRFVDGYGVRGLGIVGPIFPGVMASVVGGLALGLDRRSLGKWMTIGIIGMYGLYVLGLSLIVSLF